MVVYVLQLSSIGVENDEGARRNLRELLFTSPDVEKYISGVVREHFCLIAQVLFDCTGVV